MIGIILISLLLLTVAIIIIRKLILQLESLEDRLIDNAEKHLDLVVNLRERVLEARTRMQEIDIRGAFEADDEVGITFKELKTIIEDLSDEITKLYTDES